MTDHADTLTARADHCRPDSWIAIWHECTRAGDGPPERRYVTSIRVRAGADIDAPVQRVCETYPPPVGWRFWFQRSGDE